jgi:hypothetical protein
MAKELLTMKSEVRAHNHAISQGLNGTLDAESLKENIQGTFADFAKQVTEIRLGQVIDKKGNKLSARPLSLVQAVNMYYGINAPETNMFGKKLTNREKSMYILRNFFAQQGVYFGEDNIYTVGKKFGADHLTPGAVTKALLDHSEIGFDGSMNTGDINVDWRFIIPELILAAIRIDYEGASMHQNWIATTINISQKEIKMPQIKRGNTIPRRIRETESVPFGSLKFGQKTAEVFQVGMGFEITDDLMERSTLDMMFIFLGELGIDMAIGADATAMDVLVNGEQAASAESAPVIGVDNTTTGFAYLDIKRGTSRLQRLRRNVTRLISGENDGLAITGLNRFEGFDGPTRLSNIVSILGVPETLQHDVYPLPTNQVMLLAPDQCMAKLQYRSMKVEQERSVVNRVNYVVVTEYVGFAIIRRDARLLIDKSVTFASQGFPTYMDIDSRINQAFLYQNEE